MHIGPPVNDGKTTSSSRLDLELHHVMLKTLKVLTRSVVLNNGQEVIKRNLRLACESLKANHSARKTL